MKRTLRILVPVILLAAVALSLAGVAFARELNEFEFGLDLSSSPAESEFYGTVESISDTSWVISGQTFLVDLLTEIKGSPAVGDFVKVHATLDAAGMLVAHEIELKDAGAIGNDNDDDDDDDGNSNGNDNDDDDDNGNSNGNDNDDDDDDNGNSNSNDNDDDDDDDNGNSNSNDNDDDDDDNGNGNFNGNDNDDDDD